MGKLTFTAAVLLSQGCLFNYSLAGAQSNSVRAGDSASQLGTLRLQIQSLRERLADLETVFLQEPRGQSVRERVTKTVANRQQVDEAELRPDEIDGIARKKQARIHKPRAIKDLEAHAQTKEDFERLATLWEKEATRYARAAMEHEEEADDYATGRRFEAKTGISGGVLAHCRQLSELYRQRSRSALAAALIDHEKAEATSDRSLVLDLAFEPEVSRV